MSHKLRIILAPILFPLSFLYGCATSIRNGLFNLGILKSKEFDFPVISVGNITVGGTGKTPHVEYILELLSKKFSLAYLSRGYKRKTKGFVLADKHATTETIGDEAYQIYKKFENITVAVDEKRVNGIEKLSERDQNLNCVILDDAFQHRHVQAGVSVVLIDYHRPHHKDFLLPAGNLREKRHGIQRANIVIVTKVPHKIKPIEMRLWVKELNLYPYQFLYFTTFKYGNLIPLFDNIQKINSPEDLSLENKSVLLVSGIANPNPLYDTLVKTCSSVEHLKFKDHYRYSASDISKIQARFDFIKTKDKIIVTTEKDAVKLRNISFPDNELKQKLYYLPIKVHFLDNMDSEFDKNIYEYVTKNKRISRLHC